jgi:3,4-dihydroxy 2-butanone 4-phosphate synthase/GTP cyclohydrolase II
MKQNMNEALNALNAGDILLIVENEEAKFRPYLVASSEFLTLNSLQLMLSYSSGVLYLVLDEAHFDKLGIESSFFAARDERELSQTVSVDIRQNPYSSFTPLGKLQTIKEILNSRLTINKLITPGNVLLKRINSKGVLLNKGVFESALDISKM